MKLGYAPEFLLPGSPSTSVKAAIADLSRDLKQVLTEAHPESKIQLSYNPSLPSESFLRRLDGETLQITGSDDLGLIYGIYSLSENFLGIPALWYWMDHKYQSLPHVEISGEAAALEPSAPVWKYRGWFLNDEDLLLHWAADRASGIDFDAYDKIYEALLRCRGNLILPGTYLFADEPAYAWAARRGLMLAEHHHENLGLNTFRWPDHIPFNYFTHPEILEAAWRSAIQKKLTHGTKVIWSLGLRGRGDYALWKEVPEIAGDPAAQSALMGKILARQWEIIREYDPDPAGVLFTWMEVAELLETHPFPLPEGVSIVWADHHSGSAKIEDPGMPRKGEGEYYHLAMHGHTKGHLSPYMPLSVAKEEFVRYQQVEATSYCLINVSTVRPVFISAEIVTKWLYSGATKESTSEGIRSFFRDSMGLPNPELGYQWYEAHTRAAEGFGRTPQAFVGDQGALSASCQLLDAIVYPETYSVEEFFLHNKGTLLLPDELSSPERNAIRELRILLSDTLANLEKATGLAAEISSQCHARFAETVHVGVEVPTAFLTALYRLFHFTLEAKIAQEAGDIPLCIAHLESAMRENERQMNLLRSVSNGRWLGFYDASIINPVWLPARRIQIALEKLRFDREIPFYRKWNVAGHNWFHNMKGYHGARKEEIPGFN